MMFESSLLTQLCVENPLPTLVEVEISRSLNSAMRRAFLFFHLLAAEKLSFLATLVPYGDEMYLALQGGIEHFLLFNADTTFTELMFGLRRVQIAERALLLHAATPPASASAAAAQLREILLGPSPMPSAEERAVQYVAARDSGPFSGLPLLTSAADAVSHGIGAPASPIL